MRGEREMGRQKEMRVRRGREEQLQGCVASVASRAYWLRERDFKTQSTFLVSLNGIEAKGSHYSLLLLKFFSDLCFSATKKKPESYSSGCSVSFPSCSDVDKDTKMNVFFIDVWLLSLYWVACQITGSLLFQMSASQSGPCDVESLQGRVDPPHPTPTPTPTPPPHVKLSCPALYYWAPNAVSLTDMSAKHIPLPAVWLRHVWLSRHEML